MCHYRRLSAEDSDILITIPKTADQRSESDPGIATRQEESRSYQSIEEQTHLRLAPEFLLAFSSDYPR